MKRSNVRVDAIAYTCIMIGKVVTTKLALMVIGSAPRSVWDRAAGQSRAARALFYVGRGWSHERVR